MRRFCAQITPIEIHDYFILMSDDVYCVSRLGATETRAKRLCLLFAGEYILNSGSRRENGNNGVEEDDHLLRDASLGLDNHPLAGLTDDSLGLTDTLELENDFPSDLLGGGLLGSTNVEGLLNNDSLDLPDGFNLEEALQLVGLDEAQSEVYSIISCKRFAECLLSPLFR